MGSIVESKKVGKDGKPVTTYRAHIRRRLPGGKEASQSKSFRTKTDAKEWLRNNEADVLLEQNGKARGKTLTKVIDDFVLTPPMKGTRSWGPEHLSFWQEELGEFRITEITHGDINGAISTLQARQATRATPDGPMPTGQLLTSATVNRYVGSLSAVFNFALKRGMIDVHPMKGGKVSKLTEGKGRTRILTADEEQRLLDAADGSKWSMMRLFLRMLLTTAGRKSEVLRLRWNDVHLDESYAVLPKTKNGDARILPLVADVVAALQEAQKVKPIRSDFVFFDPRHPERPKNIDTIWKFVRQRAGLWQDREEKLDRVVLHTTRHSAVTKMIKGGANLAQAAIVSGHKTLAMLKRYEHLAAQDAVEIAQRLLGGTGEKDRSLIGTIRQIGMGRGSNPDPALSDNPPTKR